MKREQKAIDFKEEVVEYIASLSNTERAIFNEIYDRLIEQGRDLKWIYYALNVLGARSIVVAKRLFFNATFCEEIDALAAAYEENIQRQVKTILAADARERMYSTCGYGNNNELLPMTRLKLKKVLQLDFLPKEEDLEKFGIKSQSQEKRIVEYTDGTSKIMTYKQFSVEAATELQPYQIREYWEHLEVYHGNNY